MTKRKTKQPVKAVQSAPGPKTRAAIQVAREAYDAGPPRPSMVVEQAGGGDGPARMGPGHDDIEGHSAWLLSSFGTTSGAFLFQQLSSLEVATAGTSTGDQPNVAGLNAALALIGGINPTDELEGALATQMAGCHALSMAMLCRAKSTNRIDQLQIYGNLAVKLQRTFTAQMEALARLRGKGQQTVRVEHVTVHPGGQAVVGDVHVHSPGGRATSERQGQPHGTGQSQTSPALPRPDPLAHGVPIPGDAERPLPTARRAKPRRTSGQSERPPARAVQPGGDGDA